MPIKDANGNTIFPVEAPAGKVLRDDGVWVTMSGASPPYAQSDVTGLVSALEGKAASSDLSAHTGAAAPHSGHETPTGAQGKVDAHKDLTTGCHGSLLRSNSADHANTNDPSAGEKAALAGTSGTPGSGNKFVTDGDSRNTNARTPTAHNQDASTINAGTLDGDRLPAISTTKKGGVPATGTPAGKFLRDDGNWTATPAPATIVTDETTWGIAKAVGTSSAYALQDHTHGTQANPVTRANGAPVYAALANDTLAQAYATNSCTKLTVTAARTLTTTVPPAGCEAFTIILTSGTTSYTITFGTGFKPTGTLATGTTSGRVFVIHWISDGTNLYESGRTAAMVA